MRHGVLLVLIKSPKQTLGVVRGGSTAGPSHSRHFAALQQTDAFGGEADIGADAQNDG
jgi:hypothetical protein